MNKLIPIIFKENCQWGKKYECTELRKGFVRWLLTNQIVLLATKDNIGRLKKREQQEKELSKAKREEIEKKKTEIEELELIFKLNTDKKGNLFGSIGMHDVTKSLQEKNISLLGGKIIQFKPIKIRGKKEVVINLGFGIKALLLIIID